MLLDFFDQLRDLRGEGNPCWLRMGALCKFSLNLRQFGLRELQSG